MTPSRLYTWDLWWRPCTLSSWTETDLYNWFEVYCPRSQIHPLHSSSQRSYLRSLSVGTPRSKTLQCLRIHTPSSGPCSGHLTCGLPDGNLCELHTVFQNPHCVSTRWWNCEFWRILNPSMSNFYDDLSVGPKLNLEKSCVYRYFGRFSTLTYTFFT